jgi:phage tail sheath protein FI
MTSYTYPGVYVEEIPSGVRPVTGVSTSNTAFVGFFRRGPLDTGVRCNNFSDFEREFGGLDARSEASYAVQQYFLNGGSVAYVVRIAVSPDAGGRTIKAASVAIPGENGGQSITVRARSEGSWGNSVKVAVMHSPNATDYSLEIREYDGPRVARAEVFENINGQANDPRNVAAVVNEASVIVSVTIEGNERPQPSTAVAQTDAQTKTQAQTAASDAVDDLDEMTAAASHSLSGGRDGEEPGSPYWKNTASTAIQGSHVNGTGLFALDAIAPEIFNIMCIPDAPDLSAAGIDHAYDGAISYCEEKRAFLIIDPPAETPGTPKSASLDAMLAWPSVPNPNAATYYPRLLLADPLDNLKLKARTTSGTVAGIYARTDSSQGVWKAPAGTNTTLRGPGLALEHDLTTEETGQLNALGKNVLRTFTPHNNTVWGARTTVGADGTASEWKYVPVRRTALLIEESLHQGLKWAVYEPNDERLWASIRTNVQAFMQGLFRRGAFQGSHPDEAYLVKCDAETTTQADIDLGVVNIIVGFAPLKPAEFVVIKLTQLAGQAHA